MKIKEIAGFRSLNCTKVLLDDYESVYNKFLERGITLCSPELAREENADEFVVLDEDHEIVIRFADSLVRYNFKAGFCTDLASVPSIGRSFVDNDDGRIIRAALVHDANFGGHLMQFGNEKVGFRSANELFLRMMKYDKVPVYKAYIAYLSVSSPIGRKIYKSMSKFDEYNISNFVEFEIV